VLILGEFKTPQKMSSRRKFLRWSALGMPVLALHQAKAAAVTKPIVVSTWDSGLPVNEAAWQILKKNDGKALDAVEAGARSIEALTVCCVGLGGNPDRDGVVTLDACIMDHQFNCGSVLYLQRIKHPISVARKVMEQTPHVILAGEGAQRFAIANGFPLESGKLSADAEKTYKEWLKKSEYKPVINIEQQQTKGQKPKGGPFAPSFFDDGTPNHDTMGTIAIDASGNLAGACTTSGMAFKMHGRIGDSPLIGPGLYVDNEVGAAVATGQGEEIIRVAGSHLIVEMMRMGKSPEDACKIAIERIVKINPTKAKDFQACFVALNKQGEYGAYSIHHGFPYAVTINGEGKLLMAKSYFPKP
jgi:N4-(beta-N-acetylglucosaminyl)-L-asparaginase